MSSCLTTLGRSYKHPEIQEGGSQEMKVESGRPVYISSTMKPLNRFYQEITATPDAGDGPPSYFDLFAYETVPLIYHDNPDAELVLPAPKMFTQKEEFTEAVFGWYDHCCRYFGGALLPQPVSSSFWLPEPPKIFSGEEKKSSARFRTFKAALWPLLPNNYMDMLDSILEAKPINPDEEFREQVPKREVIYHKHHMTQENQWMAQLVPPEPEPIAYDSFEEYQLAFRNWARVANASMEIPLMESREFVTIAALDVVDQGAGSFEVDETRGWFPSGNNWKWVPERVITQPQMIEASLARLFKEMNNEEKRDKPGNEVKAVTVFGVDRETFVQNIQEVGVYGTNDGRQKRPGDVHWGLVRDNVEELKKMMANATSYDFSLIRQLLSNELSPAQYDDVLAVKVNENKFAVFISGVLTNVAVFRNLITISNLTESYRYRIGYMLTALFKNDPNTKAMAVLAQQDSCELLDALVRFLNLSSPYSEPIIEPTKSSIKALQKINKCYLLSVFLSIMRQYAGARFYQDAREPCRKLSLQLVKAFENQQIVEPFQQAQVDDEDMYRALMMLLETHSKEIQKGVLGYNFMKWVAFGQPRVRLMLSMAHSSCLTMACEMLIMGITQKKIDTKELVNGLTFHTADLLTMVLKELISTCEESHFTVTGQVFLPLVETALLSDREEVATLIVPLATLLCSKHFVSNWGDTSFQPLLMRVICRACEVLSKSTSTLYRERIQALVLLAQDESCCFAMSQVPLFIETLVTHLADSDVNVMNKTWNLFDNMTMYPKVVKEILSGSASLKKRLADMIDLENNVEALKRYLLFSIRVWEMTDAPGVCELMCNIMASKVGQIACLVKTRVSRFKDYPQMVDVIGNYYRAVQRMRGQGTQQFIDTLFTHFSSTIVGLQPERMVQAGRRSKTARVSNP